MLKMKLWEFLAAAILIVAFGALIIMFLKALLVVP